MLLLCLSPQNGIPVQISNTKNFSVYGLCTSHHIKNEQKHFSEADSTPENYYFFFLVRFRKSRRCQKSTSRANFIVNIKVPETGNDSNGIQCLFEVPLVVKCEDDHSSCCRDSKYFASTTSICLNDFMLNNKLKSLIRPIL